jgi:CRISPR-associated protein Cmr2
LHDDFGTRLTKYGNPTLSVGIAIGHFMENLEDLLQDGRDAEKAAKKVEGKNALAVHLHKRGGAPIHIRSKWDDKPHKRLTEYAKLLLAEAIPGKLPYELRRLGDHYANWPAATVAEALRRDVIRLIRAKQPRWGKAYMKEIEKLVEERIGGVDQLDHFARELLVAKQIAEAMWRAGGRPAAPVQPAAEVPQ